MKKLLFVLAFMLLNAPVYGADIDILMLNKQDKERNVYSKPIVNINVGDTVNWIAKSKGHNVEFIKRYGVPEGAEKYKSRLSKDAKYTFKVPGIYAYWCTPHKSMGMIGFVIVGNNKSNINSIKKIKFKGKSKKIANTLLKQIEKQ
tara:strand:- start:44 stop:481 length:438 start_codon:yes stop_codon:yes gene_type:complete